jgi:23S rRNA pseudouridine1911/1915/1917 synthase
VRIDGVACRARDSVGAGVVLEVEIGPELTSQAEPDASVPFGVVFEDEHLIVVDKPAGVVVHPARGHRTGTLVSGLLARPGFAVAPRDERDPSGHLRPGIVHRIDKGTSGLLVIAKTDAAREGLKSQLGAHTVERAYWAITVGVPSVKEIRTTHARDPRSRLRFTSRAKDGKLAVTHLRVLEHFAAPRAALVECRLETGRTHQIRVHLLEQAKTPLLGDPLYKLHVADETLRALGETLGHQALHAQRLGFVHPRTGETLRFESPPPADFQRVLTALREAPAPLR